uniref:Uncharacterized protein n=1 Tax=viral metagenome TaxID=1070528 RepID=A0A6C0JWH4_9ZZZZ
MDSKEQQNLNDWAYARIAYLFKRHDNLNEKFKYTPQTISVGRYVSPSECLRVSRDLENSIESTKKNELKE